jgi:regulatory protein
MKITKISQQVKQKDRYSIYVDDKYAFSLSESALLDSGLASGQEIKSDQLEELKKTSGLDKAYFASLRYVAIRPRSQWEIQTYLKRKGLDPDAGEIIIRRLLNLGLLDDLAFARSWIANRRALKNVSKRRLRIELLQKRLPEAVISNALAEDEVDELDALRELAKKKQARYPDRQKLIQYLARQGFNYDDIKTVLDEL